MIDAILVINSGSSSVKFCLFETRENLQILAHGSVTNIGAEPFFQATCSQNNHTDHMTVHDGGTHENAIREILEWIKNHENGWLIEIVSHRVVHGGTEFTGPVLINSDVFHKLKKLCPLAPLHQPHNLAAIGIIHRFLPHVPQIACFDTSFHANRDPLFTYYALPQALTAQGVRRYGFHGLSYEWIAHVLKTDHPRLARGRVIAAHLGNGASICAMINGKSIDTTMGMTALDGLPMGTRCGGIDPGAILYMIDYLRMPSEKVEHILYEDSGLKGLSGISNDVQALLESDDPKAKFALDYFVLKVAQYMAMMAISIGGIDAIVFTGGIGENASSIRNSIIQKLQLSKKQDVLTIPANEERMMALHTRQILCSLENIDRLSITSQENF